MTLNEKYVFGQFVKSKERLDSEGLAVTIGTILSNLIKKSEVKTLQGIIKLFHSNIDYMLKHLVNHEVLSGKTVLTVQSICEISMHHISKRLEKIKTTDFYEIREDMINLIDCLVEYFRESKTELCNFAQSILKTGDKIMVISPSKIIEHIILEAARLGKRFEVVVTESRPNCEGYKTYAMLQKNSIPSVLITDNNIGPELEKVDYVLCSAVMVTENGGVINQLGSYTAAICAHSLKKPFYVAAEDFKFSRIFPLNQDGLPDAAKTINTFDFIKCDDLEVDGLKNEPMERLLCDFTPPGMVTMFITNTGILTPSAISDELIQRFNS